MVYKRDGSLSGEGAGDALGAAPRQPGVGATVCVAQRAVGGAVPAGGAAVATGGRRPGASTPCGAAGGGHGDADLPHPCARADDHLTAPSSCPLARPTTIVNGRPTAAHPWKLPT